VVLAARVGVVDHVKIGEGAQLAARSTVMRDIPLGWLTRQAREAMAARTGDH
jgi:UDP-3-O-[3-hydroxymyristoyl] glucosamine N-acyltransferase